MEPMRFELLVIYERAISYIAVAIIIDHFMLFLAVFLAGPHAASVRYGRSTLRVLGYDPRSDQHVDEIDHSLVLLKIAL